MRYILWVAALLGACDVTQGGLGRHLGFYQKLEIVKKGEIDNFDARHVEYDIIKNFASFSQHFVLLSPKRCENTHFCSKMAWPSATYDVISRNHSNRFSNCV